MRRGAVGIALGTTIAAAVAMARPSDITLRREGPGGPVEMVLLGDDALARVEAGATRAGRATRTPGGWLDVRWEDVEGIDDLGRRIPARVESAILDPVLDPQGALAGLVGFHVAPGGERRLELHRRVGGPAVDLERRGFRHHIHAALAINEARRADYERRSGGRSSALSRRLIWLERLVLPWAAWCDWRGGSWNRRGVGLVAADFVEMRVHDAAAPPRWRGRMTSAQRAQLEARLDAATPDVKRLLDAGRFEETAARCVALLAEVEAFEVQWGCHLAMTRHVVEQTGWAALNAATWSRLSGGETDGQARSFCKGLRLAFGSAPGIDERAQAAHEVGVGVLVNDLPEIPLAAALAGLRAAR